MKTGDEENGLIYLHEMDSERLRRDDGPHKKYVTIAPGRDWPVKLPSLCPQASLTVSDRATGLGDAQWIGVEGMFFWRVFVSTSTYLKLIFVP